MLLCVGLAWLYDNTRVKTKHGHKKIWGIYLVLLALLICYGGFRGQYNDTWTYRDNYVYTTLPFPEAWESMPIKLGQSPAFNIVNSFLKTYNVEVHLYLFFYFFWTTLLFMFFIKGYAVSLPLAIFFFFTTGCYQFNMAAMKQVMATAICLAAFPLAIKPGWKNKILYFCFVLLGITFHPYAFMYFTVPILTFKPWTSKTFIIVSGIIAGSALLQPMLGTIVEITTSIGENFTVEALSGEGITIPRIVVVWVPIVLSFIYRDILFRDSLPHENAIMHCTLLFAGIQFVGMFATALYFGRLSYYFCIMPAISLTWMLKKISRYYPRDGRFLTVAAVAGYIAFFYFSNTLETHYNTAYEAITLRRFIEYFVEWVKGLS